MIRPTLFIQTNGLIFNNYIYRTLEIYLECADSLLKVVDAAKEHGVKFEQKIPESITPPKHEHRTYR